MNIGPSLAHGLTSQKNLARAHFGPTIFWPTMGRAKTEPNHSQSPSQLEPGRPVARHNPKTFTLKEYLRIHLKSHKDERQFKCNCCGKMLKNARSIDDHRKKHMNENLHQCEICQKQFIRITELKIHFRNHTGENPYKCIFCERSFRNRKQLKTHERLHTEEKTFKCGFCNKGFKYQGNLKKHEIGHANKIELKLENIQEDNEHRIK